MPVNVVAQRMVGRCVDRLVAAVHHAAFFEWLALSDDAAAADTASQRLRFDAYSLSMELCGQP